MSGVRVPEVPNKGEKHEKKVVHTDRIAHRDFDHRNSGGNASAGSEQGTGKRTPDILYGKSEAAGNCVCFLHDYAGFFPGREKPLYWSQTLSEIYPQSVKINTKKSILLCSKNKPYTGTWLAGKYYYVSYGAYSYGAFAWHGNGYRPPHYASGTNYPPAKVPQLKNISRTMLVGDSQVSGGDPELGCVEIRNTASYNSVFSGRHLLRSNVLFADGHVNHYKTAALNKWSQKPHGYVPMNDIMRGEINL